jgi:hypothetical protein
MSAAAAAARLRVRRRPDGWDAAATLADLLLHRRRLSLHDEHLPGVAIGVLDPDLVLQRVAALGVLFGQRLEPAAATSSLLATCTPK